MSRPHIKISLLSSIFICLSAVFLMSHNTYAFSGFSQSGYYGWQTSYMYYGPSVNSQSQWIVSEHQGYSMDFPGPYVASTIGRLDADIYGDVPANSIIAFNVSVCTDSGFSWAGFSGSNGWVLIDHYTASQDGNCFTEFYRFYTHTVQSSIGLTGVNGFIGSGVFSRIDFSGISWATLNDDVDYTNNLNSLLQQLTNVNTNLVIINNNISNILQNIPTAEENASAMADEEEERTQDVVDNSQDTADSSQEDTDETGTSLLSVFTSVIGVIVNSQETSCTFDSHLPFMTGAGTIDLCMFNPPVIVQTIASLLALALFVPFGLHMYKRFISITRSFQK